MAHPLTCKRTQMKRNAKEKLKNDLWDIFIITPIVTRLIRLGAVTK